MPQPDHGHYLSLEDNQQDHSRTIVIEFMSMVLLR